MTASAHRANFDEDRLLELRHDFNNDSDGIPTTADSGQTWTLSYGPSSTARPVVTNGSYIIDASGAGAAAGYLTAALPASATWMQADVEFTSNGLTDAQAAGLIAWSADLRSGQLREHGATPDTPAHVAFASSGFTFSVAVGNCLTSLGFVGYGSTIRNQHVEVAIDRPKSTAYVRGANGEVYFFKHPLIGIVSAPYVTAEVFYNAANTDNRVRFQNFAASSLRSVD